MDSDKNKDSDDTDIDDENEVANSDKIKNIGVENFIECKKCKFCLDKPKRAAEKRKLEAEEVLTAIIEPKHNGRPTKKHQQYLRYK